MRTKTDRLFLLGGKDLEMETIRKLLSETNQRYVDKGLSWKNAVLSKYSNELEAWQQWDQIYGIELTEDITTIPPNYNRIDHHNDFSFQSSCLHQIAQIVGVELNREQLLVAANDTGYIPAMIQCGATQHEVTTIRREDRKMQGVTPEDEKLAQDAINKQLSIKNGITIVKTAGDKFSPIVDQLYPCPQLLIYTQHELTYYGRGVNSLATHFSHEVSQHNMYYGGGERGYFGIAKAAGYSPDQIELYKNEIINIINKS